MDKLELQQRTKSFGLRVLKLIDVLPRSAAGRIVSGQLGRAATSVGANYRAACKARSRAEFIAKIGVVEEEADESAYWLEIIVEGGLLKLGRVKPLHLEAVELTAIMGASRITAARRVGRQSAIGNRQSAILRSTDPGSTSTAPSHSR